MIDPLVGNVGDVERAVAAAEINGEAALDAAKDHSVDTVASFEFLFKLVPSRFAAGPVARQHRFAMRILDPVNIDLDLIADLEFGFLTGRCKLAQWHATFAL